MLVFYYHLSLAVEPLLINPVLDLNLTYVNPQMTQIRSVAALPDGGAFVHNYVSSNRTDQVLRVNVRGQVIQHVYQCLRCYQGGLLVLNNNLYVIYNHGRILQITINDINTVQVYQVPDVRWMTNYGSLSYHPSFVKHNDLLLLADWGKGEIFSYNLTSRNKQVYLTGLWGPTSVSFMTYNSHLYYVVCELQRHQVHIYNSTWGLYHTLGGFGSDDGQLSTPYSAIGLPDGSVIVTDNLNNRISLFSIRGNFVRHLLTSKPRGMSISLPDLWFIHSLRSGIFGLYRYKLY